MKKCQLEHLVRRPVWPVRAVAAAAGRLLLKRGKYLPRYLGRGYVGKPVLLSPTTYIQPPPILATLATWRVCPLRAVAPAKQQAEPSCYTCPVISPFLLGGAKHDHVRAERLTCDWYFCVQVRGSLQSSFPPFFALFSPARTHGEPRHGKCYCRQSLFGIRPR